MNDKQKEGDAESKVARVEVRMSHVERGMLWDLAKKEGLPVSDYLRGLILTKAALNPDIKAYYHKTIQALERSAAQCEARQKSFWMYIDKNGLKRIYESARFSIYNTGSINMEEIRAIIKNYKAIFDTFPDEIKLIKAESFKEIEACSKLHYLTTKLKLNPKKLDSIYMAKTAAKNEMISEAKGIKLIEDKSNETISKNRKR